MFVPCPVHLHCNFDAWCTLVKTTLFCVKLLLIIFINHSQGFVLQPVWQGLPPEHGASYFTYIASSVFERLGEIWIRATVHKQTNNNLQTSWMRIDNIWGTASEYLHRPRPWLTRVIQQSVTHNTWKMFSQASGFCQVISWPRQLMMSSGH